MNYSFDGNLAMEFGIEGALLLQNIYFWQKRNESNTKQSTHYHKGRWWTYNSIKAFHDSFPFLSERQIDYTLKKLKDLGVLFIDIFHDNKLDRTKWYSVSDSVAKYLEGIPFYNSVDTILQNVKCDLQNVDSLSSHSYIDKSIYSFNDTDIKHTDIDNKVSQKPVESVVQSTKKSSGILPRRLDKKVQVMVTIRYIVNSITNTKELQVKLMEFFDLVKKKKSFITESMARELLEDFNRFVCRVDGSLNEEYALRFVKETIKRGWAGFYEIPDIGYPDEIPIVKAVKEMTLEERKKFEEDLADETF